MNDNIDWKDVAHYGSAVACLAMAGLTELGVTLPGVTVDPKLAGAAGIGILAAGLKGPTAKAAILLPFLAVLSSPALAADVSPMPVKAPPRYVSTPCTVTSCTGFFVGGNLANAGGNFDVVGTGLTGLAQNGFGMGGQAGYEFWNGQYYAAILGSIDTDLSLNGLNAGPLTTDFKSRLTYGVEAHLGYSLASIFGSATTQTATPTLPQQLLSSLMTPYLIVGEGWRHDQAALISGAGVEALIATNWTIDVDYLHYSYNQGGTAGTVAGTPITQTDDNVIRASISRHFGM